MLINRVGTFFAVLGIGLIGLYVLSDISGSPTYNYLAIGALFLGLGIFMWLRDPAPPPKETGRFRVLRSAGKKQDKK